MKEIIDGLIKEVNESDKISPQIKKIFEKALANTFTTTMRETSRKDVFVITGDIDAMWLRDSAGQIRPIFYIDSPKADRLIKKVLDRQIFCLSKDPYANAFNEIPNGRAWSSKDISDFSSPWVWERKYELDSICYVLQTAYLYYEKTGDRGLFDENFLDVLEKLVDLIELEQNHENSPYEFQRPDPWAQSDSLRESKRGTPVAYTGMSWSGFRPSDDSCLYQYLIPSNAFAVVVLRKLSKIMETLSIREDLAAKMASLAARIDEGIKKYGLVEDEDFGEIYAYETDGLGNFNLMDDANIPSILSLPYLGYGKVDDERYLRSRNFILSKKNKNYFEGLVAKGIGSDHTPKDYIWHLALSMQMMTSRDEKEIEYILSLFEKTHGGTYLTHEGFHKDDPKEYTRDWFSWSNSIFAEAILRYLGKDILRKVDLTD
ncbi:MAG: glycoside hydrolase family 125 protein [Anaerococcus sp.]|nr:glycoside hydrolase family 125 protein [Anaerococcus sp.]